MLKKSLSLVVAAVMILCFATGGGAPAEQDERVVRTAWFGSVARHELFNSLMDMFEETHPGIKVEREYASWTEYFDKLNTQLASGNAPDVFQLTPLDITKYASKGVLMDLEPYVESGVIDLDGWDQKVLDIGTFNGTFNMLSIGMSSPICFINRDLLERLGMQMPDHDLSFEEFAVFCKELQSKLGPDQYALLDPGGTLDFFVIFLMQQGKTICSEDESALGFDVEDVKLYLEYWDELRKAGCLPPADVMAEKGGNPWEDSMLVHGEVVMQMTNANQLKIFQQYMEDTVEPMRLPTMPDGAREYGEVFTGVFLTMSTGCKNPDDGAVLIDWWANDIEANKLYNMEHGVLGSSKVIDVMSSTMTEEDKKVTAHSIAVLETAPATTYRPTSFGAISAAYTAANDAIAFGAKTFEQAAEDFIVEAGIALKTGA